jgi:hypothetical protein
MGGPLLQIVLIFQIFSNDWICVIFLLPKLVSLLYTHFVLGLRPFMPSNKIDLFIYKKKNHHFFEVFIEITYAIGGFIMSEKEVLKIWRLASFCVYCEVFGDRGTQGALKTLRL